MPSNCLRRPNFGSMQKPLFVCLMVFALSIHAQISSRASFASLAATVGGRSAGLGGSAYGHPGDASMSAGNPALLSFIDNKQVGITHWSLPTGLKRGNMVIANDWGHIKNPKWRMAMAVDYWQTGELAMTDAAGYLIGSFDAKEVIPRITAAYQDGPWTAGATIKWAHLVYAGYNAQALAADLGVVYSMDSGYTQIAMVIRNVGYGIESFDDNYEPVPFEWSLSISQKLKHAPFRWNLTYKHLEIWDLTFFDPLQLVRDPLSGTTYYKEFDWTNQLMRHLQPSIEAQLGGRVFVQLGYDFQRMLELRVPDWRTNAGMSLGITIHAGRNIYQYGQEMAHVAGRITHVSLIRNL